jgi:hypothetical protein
VIPVKKSAVALARRSSAMTPSMSMERAKVPAFAMHEHDGAINECDYLADTQVELRGVIA